MIENEPESKEQEVEGEVESVPVTCLESPGGKLKRRLKEGGRFGY